MRSAWLAFTLLAGACATDVVVESGFEDEDATAGASVASTFALTGCHGQADASVPADKTYVITTFGGGSDTQGMSCGGRADGTWYYAASRQRYGCGARVAIRANGKCVVAQTDDYGPDVCVERAAARPIMDVSPRVAQYLYGTSGLGWSDRKTVTVEEVARSTPLGPCSDAPTPNPPPPPPSAATCTSATLARDVAAGTCVRTAAGSWFACVDGAWQARSGTAGCTASYDWCQSATLGRGVVARACVQSASNSAWYQCNGSGWVRPATAQSGPIGACSTAYPL
ncbi:MAG: hypothetical protein IPL61_24540 [Myxococcales bacterium]|nr:hypothetical protein [Myxococcales bacterium]